MSSYQQVLDFLKARGGIANLRELKQFPSTILDTLHLHQYIQITGRIGCHQVHLIHDEFDVKDEKTKSITELSVKPKEPAKILKKPKVDRQPKIITNSRLERCKQVKDSILTEIKKADRPMSVLELKDKFPQIRPKAIAYHLKKLEAMNLVCSIDWNTRLWTDISRKDLLESVVGTYVGRYESKNAVLNVLKNADQAMSVAGISRKLQDRYSGTTLRKILKLLVTTGVVEAGHSFKSDIVYFAHAENQSAVLHLQQLVKHKKRKLNSQPLSRRNNHESHNKSYCH